MARETLGWREYVSTDGPGDSSDGATLGQTGVVIVPAGMPMQMLSVAARATASSVHLLGKISNSPSSTTIDSATTGVTSTSSSGPFVSSVQRQDDPDAASSASAPAQGLLAVGMTSFTTSSLPLPTANLDSDTQRLLDTTADPSYSSPEPSAIVLANLEESATGAEGGFDSRILTGPLASRSAGPLGPILASTGVDPTPEVDRDERGLYQVIERRESEAGNDDLNALTGSIQGAAGENDGSVAVVSGAGGFPLMVTSLPRSRSTELRGLLSSIREGTRHADAMAESVEAGQLIDSRQAAGDAQDRNEAPGLAVLIKAACGIALGVGMSSRALFPALLLGAQKRLRRLRRQPRNR